MIGVVVFDACGQRWQLFLGNAARRAAEEQYDKGFFAIVADAMPDIDPVTAMAIAEAMSNGVTLAPEIAATAAAAMRQMRLSVLTDLAWHGLVKHQPTITLAQVDDIIDELGDDAFGDVMGRAIRAAQPTEDGQKPTSGKPAPKPRRTRPREPTGPG